MKPIKHRFRLHLSVGTPGLCPDCGEPTPFRRASILNECPQQEWTIDPALLRELAQTLANRKTVYCHKCKRRPNRLHWVERNEKAVQGPLCANCLRTFPHDMPVYVASASQSTLQAAEVIRHYAPDAPRVIVPDDAPLL